jgi:ABC-type multidrug transport system fused ATPase/permease subunit
MDDILSALDATSSKHVFEDCILNFMRNRTRVLVTHAVSLTLQKADHVVVIDNGRIVAQGPPTQVNNYGILNELISEEKDFEQPPEELTHALPEQRVRQSSHQSMVSLASTIDESLPLSSTFDRRGNPGGRMVELEDRCRGSVKARVYLVWLKAAGGARFTFTILLCLLLQQGLTVAQDLWLRQWANAFESGHEVDSMYYLSVYSATGFIMVLIVLGRLFYQMFGSLKASKALHNELFESLVFSKIRFYDVTPLGRIVNRLSRDLQTIDRDVSRDVVDCLINLFQFLSIILIITGVSRIILLFFLPIGAIYYVIGQYFLSTSRELKRLDSLSRSPIYSLFSETLSGVSIIRAFKQEHRFQAENYKRIDCNAKAFWYLWASNRWLTVRTDMVGAIVVLGTGVALLMSRDWLDPALVGVTLSYALNITDSMMWLIRVQAMVEMDMNAVERVDEWITGIKQEPRGSQSLVNPPPNWPSEGAISLENLVVQYSAAAGPILRGVTFSVKPREKVGIVGRTGTVVIFRRNLSMAR